MYINSSISSMKSDTKNIFIGSSVHRWNDNRIFFKEAMSLAKIYHVELHAPAEFEKKHVYGVDIYGLPNWEKESDRKAIRNELWQRLKKSKMTIFHFHDPELIWIGIKAKLILNKKVIYDIHEDVGSDIMRKTWLNAIQKVFYYIAYKLLESIVGFIFDHFILSVDLFKSPRIRNSTIIFNYPILPETRNNNSKSIDLLYLGAVTEDRGIFIIIEVVKKLVKKYPNLKVEIVGHVPSSIKAHIVDEIRKENLNDVIYLRGFIDYNAASDYIKRSRIGLCLLFPTKNYLNSYPTKLFDYMTCGIPIVGSNFGQLARIIKEANCGATVDPYDIQDIVRVLDSLLSKNDYCSDLGSNGWEYIKDTYTWQSQENKLLELYSNL